MDIKISIELKDKHYGFSDLLDGRGLNDQTKEEIIDLIKKDIGHAFDQQIEVEAINYTQLKEKKIPTLKEYAFDLRTRYILDDYWSGYKDASDEEVERCYKIEVLDNL